ncbi:HK97 gp10 family phage protein [Rhodopseudomonas palustris]|uniref:HK97 gp10 family phage protein n=1 Tax=Rhodopseudomonas palustris TaxID=1076 RepID=UPI000D1B6D0D|nr:HK97 gp10 family phage protein [Rhodopseudomonas palustris]
MADNVEFSVKIVGLDELVRKMKDAPNIAAPILQRALSASGAVLAKHTVKGVVPWRTGHLTTTFRADLKAGILRWFPTADYAPYVEFGTKPHIILPKNKRALFWPTAAHPVRVVHHPGTKPNKFMERIIDRSQSEIDTVFVKALKEITDAIASK